MLEALKPLRAELVELWTAPDLDLERIAKVLVTMRELTGFKTETSNRAGGQYYRWQTVGRRK